MPALRRKQNYRNIILAVDAQHETVGVYLRSGLTRDVIWKGFVDLNLAQGRPVKLHIHSYQAEDYGHWILLKDNECIQGCVVVGEGVYGVLIDGVPRVVNAIA
ncbi:MAG: hypothetical protein WBM41_15115 [Arenicellales bacterium]|jgi:hypothetical protein